jgi:hypothetical protein
MLAMVGRGWREEKKRDCLAGKTHPCKTPETFVRHSSLRFRLPFPFQIMPESISSSVSLQIFKEEVSQAPPYTLDELVRTLARRMFGAGYTWWNEEDDPKPATWKEGDNVYWAFCERCQAHHDVRVLDQCEFNAEGIKSNGSALGLGSVACAPVVCEAWKYKLQNAAAFIYAGKATFGEGPSVNLFAAWAARVPLLTFSVESIAHNVESTFRAKFVRGLMVTHQESRMIREWLPESAPDATKQLDGLILQTRDNVAWQHLLDTHSSTIRSIVTNADWSKWDAPDAARDPVVATRLAALRALKASVAACASASNN